MRTRLGPVLLFAVCLASCVPRNRVNPNCRWTNDALSPLDTQRSADVQHLMNDAMVAEDLAIRYADATRGRRSGHFAGWDEYENARERCMTTLFAAAADTHGVDAQQVRNLLGRRALAVDLSVGLAFGVLYLLLSHAVVGGIQSRFSVEEPTALVVAFLGVAPAFGACGVLALGLWAGLIEMVRLGNAHMSYRVDRLPWSHHTLELFATGVFVFLATAALRWYCRYRPARRDGVAT
jgi:hypothetical protein